MADEDNLSPTSATSNVMPLILVSHPLHRSHPATTPSLASSLKPAANNDPATPPIVVLLPRQEPLVSFSRTHHAVKTKRDNDNENSLVAPWHGPSNGCSRTAACSQTIRELSTPEHVGRFAGDWHDGTRRTFTTPRAASTHQGTSSPQTVVSRWQLPRFAPEAPGESKLGSTVHNKFGLGSRFVALQSQMWSSRIGSTSANFPP